MRTKKGHLALPPKLHHKCREMVVRIIDTNQQLVSTGIAFGSSGMVVTSGHAIQQHLAANENSSLQIQFLDGGTYPVSEIHATQFNFQEGLDFSLVHSEHNRLLPLLCTAHTYDLAQVNFYMWGFSPHVMNGTSALPVSGQFLGPMISIGGHSTLLMGTAISGQYNGFSGAAQFTYHATYGIEFSGIQSGQLGAFPGALISMPTLRLQDFAPAMFSGKFASYRDRRKSEDVFSRFAFVCDILVRDISPEDKADDVIAAIARYAPILERQLPANKLKRILAESFLSEKIVAVAISHCRPRRIEKRNALASAFGRQRWTRNMLKAMSVDDLRRISEFREEVVVFQIHGV
jgi:hypothetical protein